jgi:thiamine transport system permease protein
VSPTVAIGRAVRLVGRGLQMMVPVAFLAIMVAWPLLAVMNRSLADVGVGDVAEILGRASVRSVLWFTIWQAALSAGLTMVIGLPIAQVLARYRFRGRSALRAFTIVPFVLPTVVVAAAFDAVFDRFGLAIDRTLWAVLAAHVFFNVAVVVRVVGGFWARIDRRQVEVAATLGASPLRAWFTITLRQLVPVLIGSYLLVFLFSFTSFGVIRVLGGLRRATIETEIYRYAIARQEFDVAAVLAGLQIVIVLLLAITSARFQRRHATVSPGASSAAIPVRTPGQRLHLGAVVLLAVLILGVPVAVLIEQSLRTGRTSGSGYGLANYRLLFERADLLPVSAAESLLNSLYFALGAAVVATAVGLLAAIVIERGGLVGRGLETVSLLPLGVSAVTLGFGYLVGFAVFDLRRSVWLIPAAHAVIGLPFVLASLVPALRSIDPRVREAAAVLGATPSLVRLTVDWPLVRRAAATGAGFAAAVSIGEFGATSFLARGDESFTAPLAVFRLLSNPGQQLRGQALALSVVIGILVVLLAAAIEFRRDEGVSLL